VNLCAALAVTWKDPMATDECWERYAQGHESALTQNGDWCGIIPAPERNIATVGSRQTWAYTFYL
jgi:hypothetical protein